MLSLYRQLLKAGSKLPGPVARKVKSNAREAFELYRGEPGAEERQEDARAAVRVLEWVHRLTQVG